MKHVPESLTKFIKMLKNPDAKDEDSANEDLMKN